MSVERARRAWVRAVNAHRRAADVHERAAALYTELRQTSMASLESERAATERAMVTAQLARHPEWAADVGATPAP